MFKFIVNREKRKQVQEYGEVVLAAMTIIGFAVNRLKKKSEES